MKRILIALMAVLTASLSTVAVGVSPAAAVAPDAPTGVTASAPTDTTASVAWTPGAANGTTITGYTVTSNPAGGTGSAGAGATSVTVTGLNPSTAYTFTVVANSDDEPSAPSAASNQITTTASLAAPGAPIGVSASLAANGTTVNVSWTDGAAGNPAENYAVQLVGIGGTASVGGPSGIARGTESAAVVGVAPGEYRARVTASNSEGSPSTDAAATIVVPVPSSAPGAFVVTATTVSSTRIDLSWTDPGGNPAPTYTVAVSPNQGTVAITGRTADVTGLTPSTAYTFTVTATNSAGSSNDADGATTNAPPASAPDAPTGVSAGSPTATSLVVSWTPGDANGSTVTGFTVTSSPGGVSQTALGAGATSVTVPGLDANTAYTFTVRANSSDEGQSPASAPSAAVSTSAGAPGAPTGVTASSPTTTSAVVAWTPGPTNGATITSYTVTSSPGGISQTALGAGARNVTVPGLSPFTAYTFTVRANSSDAGSSPASAASNSVTTAAVAPNAFSATATVASSTSVNLSWTNAGGNPAATYSVAVSPNQGSVNISGRSASVTGLTPGTNYTFTITADNPAAGNQQATASARPVGLPGAPTGVTAERDAEIVNSAVVSWTAPTATGGSAITGYVVTLTPTGGGDPIVSEVDDGAATTQDVGGLSSGTYEVEVQTRNAQGLSAAADGPDVFIPDVPGLLQSIVAENTTPFGSTVQVSWEPPENDGGVPIAGYRVSMAGLTADVGPNATFARIGPLSAGFYEATIQAFGPAGDGPVLTSNQVEVRTLPPFNSIDAFVDQQYRDFLGRPSDAAGRQFWAARTAADGSNMHEIIISFMRSPEFAPRRSVVRLYQAYFRRLPDPVGFDFWSRRLAAGEGSLEEVSQFFASGDEFQATYGSLDNTEFVDLVYQNVLGRPGEAEGRAFWISELDRGLDRGRLMTLFSESPEFISTSGPNVDVVVTYRGLLDRLPDSQGFEFWTDRIASDPNALSTLIQQFIGSEEYGGRVTP